MYLLLILILIFINGLFVMTEMAFVSARRTRLQARADRGDRAARTAIVLIDHPNRYLSTAQLGITLVTIVLGMYGESSLTEDLTKWLATFPAVARYAHIIATAITLILLTFATLLLAELVPKRIGQINPEGLARLMAGPVDVFSRLAAPLVAVLSSVTDLLLKLVPIRPPSEHNEAEEEVRAILATGAELGTIHQSEQQIVERVFQLGDRRVKTLMVPRSDIDTLDIKDPVQRVRVAVATSAHSHFPVVDGDLDHLKGFVHVKDLVKHGLILGETEIHLEQVLRPPMFVPESASALKVLEQFRENASHIAFVLDEYGALVGLVTLNDLITSMLGDITLAGPDAPLDPLVVRRADGSYLLDGMLPVADLMGLMGVDTLPKREVDDYDTLGGFVMTYLGRVPATGDAFAFDRFTFEVMDMDRTRVDRVLLTIDPIPVDEQPEQSAL